jgi:hypothetical protein
MPPTAFDAISDPERKKKWKKEVVRGGKMIELVKKESDSPTCKTFR